MKIKDDFTLTGTPRWLLSAGINSILFICIAAAVAALLYLFDFGSTITIPLVLSFVVGVIAFPLVKLLDRIKLPRTVSSLVVVAVVVILGYASIQITVSGVINQAPAIGHQLLNGIEIAGEKTNDMLLSAGISQKDIDSSVSQLMDSIENTLSGESSGTTSNAGVVDSALSGISQGLLSGFSTLTGLLSGLFGLTFGLFIGALLLFYMLKDYENIIEWVGAHLGVAPCIGSGLVDDAVSSMRDYFKGVTITAVIVTLGVGVGLLALKVPLVVPIMIVTFLTSYIPFFGALIAGLFACLIALGSGGVGSAALTLVVVILAQNILQSIAQNKFLGESLDMHPIVVLAITIAGSTFAGLLGATLAAPILATVLRARARLRLAKELEVKGEDSASIEEVVLHRH